MFRAKIGKRHQLPHKGLIPKELGVVFFKSISFFLILTKIKLEHHKDKLLLYFLGSSVQGAGPHFRCRYWVQEPAMGWRRTPDFRWQGELFYFLLLDITHADFIKFYSANVFRCVQFTRDAPVIGFFYLDSNFQIVEFFSRLILPD